MERSLVAIQVVAITACALGAGTHTLIPIDNQDDSTMHKVSILEDVIKNQTMFNYHGIDGTVVGMWSPSFAGR